MAGSGEQCLAPLLEPVSSFFIFLVSVISQYFYMITWGFIRVCKIRCWCCTVPSLPTKVGRYVAMAVPNHVYYLGSLTVYVPSEWVGE